MRWLNVRCLVLGHEDRVRQASGRMYWECAECGRETTGWNVTRDTDYSVRRGGHAAPRSWTRAWRALRSQASADSLPAVGLR
jgi:hypothetical protein